MNVLALCAGVGGLELGLKLAEPGARCVCHVEGEGPVAAVLVRRMQEGVMDDAPVWSDLRSFDGRPWRGTVDCVTAGFPCQPFSQAGRQRAERDERHLWPHVARVVREAGPRLCFFENVPNLLSRGAEAILGELEGMGYRVAAGLFSAEEVGSTHIRERLFILAEASAVGDAPGLRREGVLPVGRGPQTGLGQQQERRLPEPPRGGGILDGLFPPDRGDFDAWRRVCGRDPFSLPALAEPVLQRMADGVAGGLDRVRAAGNAVCPLVAGYAYATLRTALCGSGR